MIHNVLEISRAEVGKLQALLEDVDLASLTREAAGVFRRQAEQQGRRLRIEAPSVLPGRADPSLLQRVLQNLLRNALRHTPSGTDIVLRVDGSDPSRTAISVEDQGPGIPAPVQALLFEPFGAAALRSAGVRVDTGLGLASCRIAARAFGADVTVRSDPGRGTTFTVSILRASADEGDAKRRG
jgi:signal transduction histidine kinase